ncbi:hypothetical protein BUZ01_05210 [Staphylococcus gallinarum]|uniref:Uncharacterized protein n=1 Tax=Staphylococcus gallinarum TaxID=1293 RepID=A0A418HR42_STAGA|nr:hypothetical protein BUZ01_05210 [Staphylococcus gallinarum]
MFYIKIQMLNFYRNVNHPMHKAYLFFVQYYILLARFPRGQLQPVVFSLSCSHRSLAKILLKENCFILRYKC